MLLKSIGDAFLRLNCSLCYRYRYWRSKKKYIWIWISRQKCRKLEKRHWSSWRCWCWTWTLTRQEDSDCTLGKLAFSPSKISKVLLAYIHDRWLSVYGLLSSQRWKYQSWKLMMVGDMKEGVTRSSQTWIHWLRMGAKTLALQSGSQRGIGAQSTFTLWSSHRFESAFTFTEQETLFYRFKRTLKTI